MFHDWRENFAKHSVYMVFKSYRPCTKLMLAYDKDLFLVQLCSYYTTTNSYYPISFANDSTLHILHRIPKTTLKHELDNACISFTGSLFYSELAKNLVQLNSFKMPFCTLLHKNFSSTPSLWRGSVLVIKNVRPRPLQFWSCTSDLGLATIAVFQNFH